MRISNQLALQVLSSLLKVSAVLLLPFTCLLTVHHIAAIDDALSHPGLSANVIWLRLVPIEAQQLIFVLCVPVLFFGVAILIDAFIGMKTQLDDLTEQVDNVEKRVEDARKRVMGIERKLGQ